jgi:hypothetical protein
VTERERSYRVVFVESLPRVGCAWVNDGLAARVGLVLLTVVLITVGQGSSEHQAGGQQGGGKLHLGNGEGGMVDWKDVSW